MASAQASTALNKGDESEAVVFSTVLFYSLSILLAPLITFLVGKFACGSIFGLEVHTGNVTAAIAAVIVLHLMLGLFIYRTFYPAKKQTKQD